MTLSNRDFYLAVAIATIVKLLLIYHIPLTGDEAYFTQWAKYPDWGYYDHPPMIGWVMYLLGNIYFDISFFRLVSVVTGFVVAYVLYKLTSFYDKESARYIAVLFLISPFNLFLTLITNDIVLLLFSSLSVLYFYKSYKEENRWFAALSGVFLGLGFLSKYFAVFIALGFLVYTLIKRDKQLFLTLFIVFLAVLPFGIQNLIYNYNSCWNNILFNLVARTKESSYNITTVLSFLGITVYLVTPWGVWYLIKNRGGLTRLIYPATILLLPLILFFIVSLKNSVGLHWVWSFIPYVFILFILLNENEKVRMFRYTAVFTLLHALIFSTILLLPVSAFEKSGEYNSIVMGTKPQEVCKILENYETDLLFADGYTPSAMLEYHCQKEVHVLFSKSKYGRQDDKNLNVKNLDGKNLVIFRQEKVDPNYLKYFEQTEVNEYTVEKTKFIIIKGENFNYTMYRDNILKSVKRNYYTAPKWLPMGRCYFNERYFNE